MKIKNLKNLTVTGLCFFCAMVLIFTSCNKALPDATPIIYPPVNKSSSTIGDLLNTDTSFSFFKAAATKVGMLAQFSDTTKILTAFIPDNNAFRASGIPSVNVVNALPLASLGGIVGYSIIPGQQYLSTTLPATFPNVQLPTSITIGQLPGTPINLQLTTFPSVSATGFYDNNIPVVKPDMKMKNGVVHVVAAIVAPPSQVLRDAMYNNPNLTYFKAAIARADSGETGLNRFDSLLNYPVTNMTVLAPNDAAFQTLIFGLAFQSYLSHFPAPTAMDTANAVATANGAVAAGPVFLSTNNVSTALIRGVLAYHFLATDMGGGFQPNIRVFSVNIPPTSATPFFITTLVNSSFALHPGIKVDATYTGPFVTKLQFTGLGTFPSGGTPYSGPPANAASMDNHAVNGVYYVIDKVLLPE
ncbi:MAG TPA: fasciclin domain-containing protein [Hanamia sp.]|nr:fasciclin domain-containing protein [Hanamia sp.]